MNPRVVRTSSGLDHLISGQKTSGKRIGFVPTMGALHAGHASLLNVLRPHCDCLVVSIFANPTQFDNKDDLTKYPRTIESDIALLKTHGADIVFIPFSFEIYYKLKVTEIDYGVLTETLEGAHRPGHFNGMTTIVRELLSLVNPDVAAFGEKDWQQLAIIRHMVQIEGIKTQIIGSKIIRESDGLAMSSRNRRLSIEERKNALAISAAILNQNIKQNSNVKDLENDLTLCIKEAGLKPDYVKIVSSKTLQSVTYAEPSVDLRILIAAYSGVTRLIDNAPLKVV